MGTAFSKLPLAETPVIHTFFGYERGHDVDQHVVKGLKKESMLRVHQSQTLKQKQENARQRGLIGEEDFMAHLGGSDSDPKNNTKSKAETKSRSRSRLPTRVRTLSNDAKKVENANNELNMNIDLDPHVGKSKVEAIAITQGQSQQEMWPSQDMLTEFLNKLQGMPTTLLFAKFMSRSAKQVIEIRYSYNRETEESKFETDGRLDSLVPIKDGRPLGETQAEHLEFFNQIFKHCINLFQGQVWLNGYSLIVDQKTTKKRLRVIGFEWDAAQLIFELSNMKDLQVLRRKNEFELRGIPTNGEEEEQKSFAITGPLARDLKIGKLGSHLVTVHIPDFRSLAA